jgi:hypothetical protein
LAEWSETAPAMKGIGRERTEIPGKFHSKLPVIFSKFGGSSFTKDRGVCRDDVQCMSLHCGRG